MKSNLLSQEEWDIYCIYGVSSCYIQLYTPSTSDFLGRKKSSVSGLYSWIQPSETPYIHYIYIVELYRDSDIFKTTLRVRPFDLSSHRGLRQVLASPMGRESPRVNVTAYAQGLIIFYSYIFMEIISFIQQVGYLDNLL